MNTNFRRKKNLFQLVLLFLFHDIVEYVSRDIIHISNIDQTISFTNFLFDIKNKNKILPDMYIVFLNAFCPIMVRYQLIEQFLMISKCREISQEYVFDENNVFSFLLRYLLLYVLMAMYMNIVLVALM